MLSKACLQNHPNTPIIKGTKLIKDSGSPFLDPTSYRKLIFNLIYFTNTRLKISYLVQHLSQHISSNFFFNKRTKKQATISMLVSQFRISSVIATYIENPGIKQQS